MTSWVVLGSLCDLLIPTEKAGHVFRLSLHFKIFCCSQQHRPFTESAPHARESVMAMARIPVREGLLLLGDFKSLAQEYVPPTGKRKLEIQGLQLTLTGVSPLSLQEKGSLVTVSRSPNKGLGLFAVQDIPAGTLIVGEKPLMVLRHDQRERLGVFSQFEQLAPEDKTRYLDLSYHPKHMERFFHAYLMPSPASQALLSDFLPQDGTPLSKSKLLLCAQVFSIFRTNSWGDGPPGHSDSRAQVYLTLSRPNHSCIPNMHPGDRGKDSGYFNFRATTDIKAGEELTVRYFECALPLAERQRKASGTWGFICECPACDVNDLSVNSAAFEFAVKELKRLKKDPYIDRKGNVKRQGYAILSPKTLQDMLHRSQSRADMHNILRSHPLALCLE